MIVSAWYQVIPSVICYGTLDADDVLLALCGYDYFLTRYVMAVRSILTAVNLVMINCQQTDYRLHCVATADWMQTTTLISDFTYLRCWLISNDIYLEDFRSGLRTSLQWLWLFSCDATSWGGERYMLALCILAEWRRRRDNGCTSTQLQWLYVVCWFSMKPSGVSTDMCLGMQSWRSMMVLWLFHCNKCDWLPRNDLTDWLLYFCESN